MTQAVDRRRRVTWALWVALWVWGIGQVVLFGVFAVTFSAGKHADAFAFASVLAGWGPVCAVYGYVKARELWTGGDPQWAVVPAATLAVTIALAFHYLGG